jgi:hypothetical protein
MARPTMEKNRAVRVRLRSLTPSVGPKPMQYATSERLDDLHELIDAVAVLSRVADEFVGASGDCALFGAASDGDAAPAPELEQPFLSELSQRAEDGVRINAEHGCKISRWREPLARLRFAVGDRAADLGGDLRVQFCRFGAVDLDTEHGASNSSAIMAPLLLPKAITGALLPPVSPEAELEALIREARERQRRRRRHVAVVLVGIAAAAGLAAGVWTLTASSVGVEHVHGGPVVNIGAFAQHGRLAFVSRKVLWVLDGEHNKLTRMPAAYGGFTPAQPAFSRDGKWLAYLQQRDHPVSGQLVSRLWIARADGSEAHVVPGVVDSIYGWSPAGDVVAFSAGPERTKQPCPCYAPETLRIVTPDLSSRVLASGPWIYGAAWSPDGRAIAVGIEGPRERAVLASYPLAGGPRTVWLRLWRHTRLNGMSGVLVDPAGWWRGFGIGFWVFGDGSTHNNDETPLDAITAPGAQPTTLAQTLSDGTTDTVASSPAGRLAVVADVSEGRNGGRLLWSKKQVQICTPAAGCGGLVQRASKVTLDPAWSPTGRTLAFIEAPAYTSAGTPPARLHRWYADHRLLLYSPQTGTPRGIPVTQGVTVPAWSADGRSLLYVSRNALWLLPTLSAKPVEIASPLFATGTWPQYYAQVPWNAQFAWWSR